MITKDPALTAFLLSVFALMMISGIVDFLATTRLARWLYLNRREIWRDLGRPGTTLFKGDPDNGYFRRTSALSQMYRTMPLREYRQQLAGTDADRYIRLHGISRAIGIILMILFGAGIFWGIQRDKSRANISQQSEQAVAPNRSLPPTLNSASSVRGSEDI